MAVYCEVCGKKIGGFGGEYRADALTYERAKKVGLTLPKNICMRCAGEKIYALEKSSQDDRKKLLQENELKNAESEKVFISPASMPDDYKDLGLVTGYCIMGTGSLATFASSWTDFSGEESNVYLVKIEKAETFALSRAKRKAYDMGATAIYNLKIGLSEAATGHGMLMISVSGSAARKKDKTL